MHLPQIESEIGCVDLPLLSIHLCWRLVGFGGSNLKIGCVDLPLLSIHLCWRLVGFGGSWGYSKDSSATDRENERT